MSATVMLVLCAGACVREDLRPERCALSRRQRAHPLWWIGQWEVDIERLLTGKLPAAGSVQDVERPFQSPVRLLTVPLSQKSQALGRALLEQLTRDWRFELYPQTLRWHRPAGVKTLTLRPHPNGMNLGVYGEGGQGELRCDASGLWWRWGEDQWLPLSLSTALSASTGR